MSLPDLIISQITDLFRWALLVGLVFTMARNRAVTGTWVPLLAGIVFVAVLLPVTMTPALAPLAMQVGTGLAANAVMLAAILLVRRLVAQFRGTGG